MADFGFDTIEFSSEESESRTQISDDDIGSIATSITKQSQTVTTVTGKMDDKTTVADSITEGEESVHDFNRNRILRELIEARQLPPMEFIRKKCMLSSRFSPVKVESILSQCARKKKMNYKPQRKDAIAIAGITKLYVYDLVLRAKEIMGSDDSMITPEALRQAAFQWKQDNEFMFPQ